MQKKRLEMQQSITKKAIGNSVLNYAAPVWTPSIKVLCGKTSKLDKTQHLEL